MEMGMITWGPNDGFHFAPARIDANFPNALRIARYPDGSERVQGAYAWSQGIDGGMVWRDLPIVDVDEKGVEID